MTQQAQSASTESSAEFYDDMWQSYGHLDAVSPANFHRRRAICELVKKHAPDAKSVLDVGCGMGELLRDIHRTLPNARISGADVSRQSLAMSAKHNPTYDLFQLDLTAADFTSLHADRLGAHDLVTCSEVLEHIADHRLAARNLARLVRPGGTVVVSVPGGAKSKFDIAIGHQRHYRPRDAALMLSEARLDVIAAFGWGFPFHSLYRTAVRLASRFAIKDDSEKTSVAAPPKKSTGMSSLLSGGYTLMSRTLHPLFYLNLNRWGEQTFVVARRPD